MFIKKILFFISFLLGLTFGIRCQPLITQELASKIDNHCKEWSDYKTYIEGLESYFSELNELRIQFIDSMNRDQKWFNKDERKAFSRFLTKDQALQNLPRWVWDFLDEICRLRRNVVQDNISFEFIPNLVEISISKAVSVIQPQAQDNSHKGYELISEVMEKIVSDTRSHNSGHFVLLQNLKIKFQSIKQEWIKKGFLKREEPGAMNPLRMVIPPIQDITQELQDILATVKPYAMAREGESSSKVDQIIDSIKTITQGLALLTKQQENGQPSELEETINSLKLAIENLQKVLSPFVDEDQLLKIQGQVDVLVNLPLKELSEWAKTCGAMLESLLQNFNDCLTEENKKAIRDSLKNVADLIARHCREDDSGRSLGGRLATACVNGINDGIIEYFNSKNRILGYVAQRSPLPPFLFAIAIGLGFVGGSITLGSKLAAGLFESTASLWRLWRMNQPLILQKMNAGHDYGDCVFGAASSDVVVVKKVASNLDRCNKGILRKKATSLRFPCHILSGDNLSVLTAMKMIANQTKIPVYRLNLASVTTASQPVEVMKRVLDFVKRYKVILFLQMQEQSCANQAVLDELVNFIIVGNSNSFNGACFIDGSRYVPGNIAGLCKKNKIELKAKFFAVK